MFRCVYPGYWVSRCGFEVYQISGTIHGKKSYILFDKGARLNIYQTMKQAKKAAC